ncbi:MAG TPA: hypothetical protein VFB48_01060 [Nitrososphaeraceae archaeon]|nr:hypothetical protein [Nitrososphaeraceae archaeon]
MNKVPKLQIANIITNSKKYPYLIVFSVAIFLRLVPDLLAFPYPIGYDVINYYLPVIKNFEGYWPTISNQFPFYVSLLYGISEVFHIEPRLVISASIILVFGFFSLAIFSIGRNLLRLDNLQSIFLSIFVMFQMAVLRTSWDLHKDMFALTLTFFSLLLISKIPNISKKLIAVTVTLSVISILADRMIGLLLSITLIGSSLVKRDRDLAIAVGIVIVIFGISLQANYDNIGYNLKMVGSNNSINVIYNPINLIVLFLVTNAFLLPSGIVGFIKSKLIIFKIPLLISAIGSFTWVIFPNTSAFLPDRWIVIFSIFLSLFSGYGFITLIENRRIALFSRKLNNYLIIIIPFIFLGSAFAASPNNSYVNIYGAFHQFIGPYGPLTMQYNSISLPESRSLQYVVDWINNDTNTGEDSVIMGSKHLRGWMGLELEGRTFLFADNNTRLLESNKYSELYLLDLDSRQATEIPDNYLQALSYNNTDLSLYHLKRIE